MKETSPNPTEYTSKAIDLGASYTDVRLIVTKTTIGRQEDTYHRYIWSLDEFQMYEAVEAKANKALLTILVDSINKANINTEVGRD